MCKTIEKILKKLKSHLTFFRIDTIFSLGWYHSCGSFRNKLIHFSYKFKSCFQSFVINNNLLFNLEGDSYV
jgi:hypothetical protein